MRRARLSLLAAPVAALVLAIMGLVAVEAARPAALDPEYAARLAVARAAESRGRPLLLVLGSSRVVAGFAPESLPPLPVTAVNFGRTGSGPVGDRLALDRLERDGVAPRFVILEAMPAYLGGEDDGPLLAHSTCTEWAGLGERVPAASLLAAIAPRARALPTLLRRTLRGDSPAGPHTDLLAQGGLAHPRETVTDAERAELVRLQAVHYRGRMAAGRIAPAAGAALRASLAWCRARGVGAAVLWTPEGRDFRAIYAPGAEARLHGELGALCAQEGVPLIDARDWLGEKQLGDGQHALAAGAVAFTARLAPHLAALATRR